MLRFKRLGCQAFYRIKMIFSSFPIFTITITVFHNIVTIILRNSIIVFYLNGQTQHRVFPCKYGQHLFHMNQTRHSQRGRIPGRRMNILDDSSGYRVAAADNKVSLTASKPVCPGIPSANNSLIYKLPASITTKAIPAIRSARRATSTLPPPQS